MRNTRTAWLPAGPFTESQRQALAVQTESAPGASLHRSLLAQRLQQLVDANPQEARRAMEMSREEAPELWAIGQSVSPQHLGQAFVDSDSFCRLLSMVDWTQPGIFEEFLPEQSLWEIVELVA